MSLTFEAVRKFHEKAAENLNPKETINCDYVIQIIENYIPAQKNEKMDSLICFRISDGFAKMKAIFQKSIHPDLVKLRENERLQQFPVIKVFSYRIAVKSQLDDITILIIQYDNLQMMDRIIGEPISYRQYVIDGYKNQNGQTAFDEFDFKEFEQSISQELKQLKQDKQQELKSCTNTIQNINNDTNQYNNDSSNHFEQVPQQQQQKKKSIIKISFQKQQPVGQIIEPWRVQDQFQPIPSNIQKIKQQKNDIQKDYFPLVQISPSFQQPFRGRIVKINEIKNYQAKTTKKEGKLFAIMIRDEEHMITATFFDAAADKFYEYLVQGSCYLFSKVQVKQPRNAEALVKQGCLPFDFTFDQTSEISEIEDLKEIPLNTFNFVKLNTIKTLNVGQIIDVIVIIKQSSGAKEFQAKNREEKSMRIVLTVYDESLQEVDVSLYGQTASQYPYNKNDIYLIKSIKVGEYQGKKNLVNNFQTSIYDGKNTQESINLRNWLLHFDGKFVEQVSKTISISQLSEQSLKCELDVNLKLFSEIRAQLVMIKNTGTLYYLSCQNCYKKAMCEDNQYFCESCQISMPEPKCRFIFNCKIADSTGNIWVSCSDEYAQHLVNITANQLKQFTEENKEKEKTEALSSKYFQEFRFKITTQLEEYNDIKRVKHQVRGIVPVSNADTKAILEQVDQYLKHI